jgi:predicted secreted hydrolase
MRMKLVRLVLALLFAWGQGAAAQALQFPRDFGAHPDYKSEWWYVTGWLERPKQEPLGFQITFFRSPTGLHRNNPSQFAPRQILAAHVALSDPRDGKLLHFQKRARAGFDLVAAKEGDTSLRLENWTMQRQADGSYRADIATEAFQLQLEMQPQQPLLLQGEQGYSRKGPNPGEASYYYSEPQLKVKARLQRKGETAQLTGVAWLDHEWSNQYVAKEASGWDWIGANLPDGGALMAFQMRDVKGGKRWAHATLRQKNGEIRQFSSEQVSFSTIQSWQSPKSGVRYPIMQELRLQDGKGELSWRTEPLQQDQELDGRASTGILYWEGAVRLWQKGQSAGLGYLEMTGYDRPVQLP